MLESSSARVGSGGALGSRGKMVKELADMDAPVVEKTDMSARAIAASKVEVVRGNPGEARPVPEGYKSAVAEEPGKGKFQVKAKLSLITHGLYRSGVMRSARSEDAEAWRRREGSFSYVCFARTGGGEVQTDIGPGG